MDFTVVVGQVFILFVILIVGFIARKLNILNNETNKGLTEFLVNITMPFTIIASFSQVYPKKIILSAGMIFAVSFFIHLFSAIIGTLLFNKFDSNVKKVLQFIIVFSNCGFMGIPIMESIYGNMGVLYSSIYIIPFNLFVWTYGQMVFSKVEKEQIFKKAILNPGVIAVLIGIIYYFLPIKSMPIINKPISIMGSLTTPLSMIIIGSMLAGIKINDVFKNSLIYYGAALRLIIMPLVTFCILRLIGLSGEILIVSVLSAGMPAAANTVIFAEKFGGDSVLSSKIVFFTTLMSILTIPGLLLILTSG